MVEKLSKKELVKQGSTISPTIHVGKEGVSEGVIEEIKTQIKRSKLIKVKVLPAAGEDIRDVASELAKLAEVKCVETRGFTILLCDPKIAEN
ncbi:YhbY family RNA-binding protein [Candidatus Methanomassiliicoccus intestinalis]|uniref:YhbY family RNA-binding protein n=1 Tax=Candidatus Methanomassiliicoccus intestinalis TaxID=1406512 RepID=UPI0037DD656F